MRFKEVFVLFMSILGLAACGDGGGDFSGDGGGTSPSGVILSDSGTVSSIVPAVYHFNTTAMRAYSARLVSTTGDADLFIYTKPLNTASFDDLLGDSWSSSGIDDVSFIVPSDTSAYAHVFPDSQSANYDLQVFYNHLSVDGPQRTRGTQNKSIYFSFDAVAGQTYNVKVTPMNGDPRLRVYSNTRIDLYNRAALKPDGLIGTSDNPGTQVESIVFVATETKPHYVEVTNNNTSTDIIFSVNVETTEAKADLQVILSSLNYSSGNLTVNYTVSNIGVAHSTGVNLHFWLDSESPPTSGSVGDSHLYIGPLAPGASYSRSQTMNVEGLESGTFYAYIDPENILPEADETNNVSAGWYWTAPVQAPQYFDFEDGLVPLAFTFSGDADWSVAREGEGGSIYSFRSGTITANQTSCFQLSVNGVESVTFDWKALADYSTDYLRFYVNNTVFATYSGANTWVSRSHSFSNTSLRTYKWCYVKGGSDNLEVDDGGWVDNIVFNPELPDLSVVLNSVTSDGTDLTINYTVTNTTGAAAASTTIDFWANSSTPPNMGSAGEVQLIVPVIAGNGSFTGTATVPSTESSGTAYAIVDTHNTLSEKNENNNISAGVEWIYLGTPLAEYDFEDGLLPGNFVSSGNAGWQIDETTSSSGTVSIRASTITHSQSACTAVTVENSSAISFDWKVSSESNYDFLRFYINGNQQAVPISGDVNWTGKTFSEFHVGTNEFKWCYTKDHMVTHGSDTGWVDNIRVY
jgi:hypothetical protein